MRPPFLPPGLPRRYLNHGARELPPWAEHVWLVELDVGWTGDIVDALLATLGARNGTRQGDGGGGGGGGDGEPDWHSFNTMRANAGWHWYAARNFLPDGGVWRSYRHAARASARLLAALAAELSAGHVASDEAMAPSVCAAAAGWCVIDASWQPGHPALGVDAATGEALYRWELLIPPERWAAVVAADGAAAAACAAGRSAGGAPCLGGKLYHKLKW